MIDQADKEVSMLARWIALVVAFALSSVACASSTRRASAPSALVDARVPSADGVSIHYVTEGSGPAVVLAHCLGCDLHYWDAATAELARDHRVIRMDLAGHGTSGSERASWSIDGFVADIRAVVNAVGAERFTLVGHSMSGPIALETAKQLGDRVTGVVPVDSILDADGAMPPEKRAELLAWVRTDYPGFVEKTLPALMPKVAEPTVLARVRADQLRKDPVRTAAILDGVLAYPEGATLDTLAMPIVAIDSDLRPAALDHNRRHAPQFDLRMLPGTGHFLLLDQPSAFAKALREVVETIEAGEARRRVSISNRRHNHGILAACPDSASSPSPSPWTALPPVRAKISRTRWA